MGTPKEGCCLRCGKPIFVKVPGKNNGICPDCVAFFEKKMKSVAARKGKTYKNTTFYHPPDYQEDE